MKTRGKEQRTQAVRRSLLVLGIPLILFVATQCTGFIGYAPSKSSRRSVKSGNPVQIAVASVGTTDDVRDNAKSKLLDLLDDETLAEEIFRPEGKPMRGRVDEAIVMLERSNPCDEPAYSELIDGGWKVKYSSSYAPGMLSSPTRELALFLYGGGYSLGGALSSFVEGFWGQSLGLKLGAKTVNIREGRDVDSTAEIEIAGRTEKLSYTAELLPLSGQRLSEEILTFDLPGPLGKRDLPLELRRSILVTYLDEEVMIVRDESGMPEVLVRETAPVSSDAPSSSSPLAADDPALSEAGEDPMSSEAA